MSQKFIKNINHSLGFERIWRKLMVSNTTNPNGICILGWRNPKNFWQKQFSSSFHTIKPNQLYCTTKIFLSPFEKTLFIEIEKKKKKYNKRVEFFRLMQFDYILFVETIPKTSKRKEATETNPAGKNFPLWVKRYPINTNKTNTITICL